MTPDDEDSQRALANSMMNIGIVEMDRGNLNTAAEQFRAAHANAGNNRGKVEYLSGPHFEGFEVIIHEDKNGVRAADAA